MGKKIKKPITCGKNGDAFANIIISDASFQLSFHKEMNEEDSFQNSPIWGLIYTPKNPTIGATSVSWNDRMEEGLISPNRPQRWEGQTKGSD